MNCNFENFGIEKRLGEIAETMETHYTKYKNEIDAMVEKIKSSEMAARENMTELRVGDIVRAYSAYHNWTTFYVVGCLRDDYFISQPDKIHHGYSNIIAVYRFDGTDFKCIWERKDYTEFKSGNGELL